ncbi:MAG: hypothetical protein WDM88_11110 [Galbitalea sp.]
MAWGAAERCPTPFLLAFVPNPFHVLDPKETGQCTHRMRRDPPGTRTASR